MPTENRASNWYAAQTKPNSHGLARRNLEQQGFEVFLPMEESSLRRGKQFRIQRRPLFAGYLFIYFSDRQETWRTINNTYGVNKLITSGANQKPAAVPAGLIVALKAQCDDQGIYRGSPALQAGDRVSITRGPFAEFVATVDSLSPQQRIWILLDIMGSKMRVEIPGNDLHVQH